MKVLQVVCSSAALRPAAVGADVQGAPERFQVPPGGQPFDGFRWRRDERLKLNYLWVLLYMTAPPDHVSKVWFDHIVVSTAYIGPIQTPTNQPKDSQ